MAAALVCSACANLQDPASAGQIPTPPASYEYASSVSAESAAGSDWYRGFGSEELAALIAHARDANTDLAAAQARILQADARARAAGGALLPDVRVGGNINRFAGRARGISANETDWSALLSASYEIDFWGRNRAGSDSAKALVRATLAERETLWLTLASNIAGSYFRLLSLRERLAFAMMNQQAAQQLLQVLDARVKAGAASATDLANQQAAAASAEIAVAELRQQEAAEREILAVLTGNDPEHFATSGKGLEELKEPAIAAGLPAQLLTRRPDLLAAESRLSAAHADLRVAQAALLPTVTLTGSGGMQNPAVQAAVTTLEGSGSTLVVGANIVQSIFDGGRRRAVRAEAAAREQELLADYRSAIRNALLDAETALSAIQFLEQQRAAQAERLLRSTQAFDSAEQRFRAGSGDYFSVLQAQNSLQAARDQNSAYRLARLQALVSLCKALGGGWQSESLQSSSTSRK